MTNNLCLILLSNPNDRLALYQIESIDRFSHLNMSVLYGYFSKKATFENWQ